VSAESLCASLADAGFAAEVEARDRLAVIRPRDAIAAHAIAAQRERVSAIAARHGFSHTAMEIATRSPRTSASSDAPLSRD
jgi:hypothetical protein